MKWIIIAATIVAAVLTLVLWNAVGFDSSPKEQKWEYLLPNGKLLYIYGHAWGIGGGSVKFAISCRPLSAEEVRSPRTEGVAHVYDATSISVSQLGTGLVISSPSLIKNQLSEDCLTEIEFREGQPEAGLGDWDVLNIYKEGGDTVQLYSSICTVNGIVDFLESGSLVDSGIEKFITGIDFCEFDSNNVEYNQLLNESVHYALFLNPKAFSTSFCKVESKEKVLNLIRNPTSDKYIVDDNMLSLIVDQCGEAEMLHSAIIEAKSKY